MAGDTGVRRRLARRAPARSQRQCDVGRRAAGGYVATEVELGYATTTHRAQGRTVETAHAVIDPDTATRELFYVAMTRGSVSNDAYVATSSADEHTPTAQPVSARDALERVVARPAQVLTATETLRLEMDTHRSLATLMSEYETIAAHAVAIGAAEWPAPAHIRGHRIGGLITKPIGDIPTAYRTALEQREQLIFKRADDMAESARHGGEEWIRDVEAAALETVALYRAHYDIISANPLGSPQDVKDPPGPRLSDRPPRRTSRRPRSRLLERLRDGARRPDAHRSQLVDRAFASPAARDDRYAPSGKTTLTVLRNRRRRPEVVVRDAVGDPLFLSIRSALSFPWHSAIPRRPTSR